HAILIYLSCAFPDIATHWYPTYILKRSKINSVLDWHHTNLRRVGLVFNTIMAPLKGLPPNPEAANDGEKLLVKSLSKLQNFWLEDGRFLVGSPQPSIADISLVCEIIQLEKDHDRILSPYKKVVQWIEDTKGATTPHFDEVHGAILIYLSCAFPDMASHCSSSSPAITGCALTELMELSGETKIHEFIKFFFFQRIVEEKAFTNLLWDQANYVRSRLTKLHIMIREMEAMDDWLAVFDSLDCLRGTIRMENDRLASLTQLLEYNENKDGLQQLFEQRSYTNNDMLLLYPKDEDVILLLLGELKMVVRIWLG
nr:glutathione S-transferase T1-like [Tanacetum cinerariifolium]